MAWNLFDLFIVSVAVIEMVMKACGHSKTGMSILRVLRFFKVSRVFRMFNAMRIFKEIRVMVDSLVGSFAFFTWCAGMLVLFLSLFAIFFVQGMTTMLEERPDLEDSTRRAVERDFGSVSAAMLSLLMAVSGGNDWGAYHDVVKEVGVLYSFLYLFFIMFSMIAFFNVITSVFCEKAMHLATPTMTDVMLEMKKKEVEDASELLSLLSAVSKDDDIRTIDSEKFEEFLSHAEVVTYFELRGFNESSVRRFFKQLLDMYHTTHIDFGTFASACVKLGGSASSADVHMLSVEMKAMRLQQSRFQDDLWKVCSIMDREVPVGGSPLRVASPCRTRHILANPLRAGEGRAPESSVPSPTGARV